MKVVFTKNVFIKYMLMMACLILFIAGGFRGYNLYKTYKSYKQEIAIIEKNTDDSIHNILRAILTEAYEMTENNTKNDSITLHRIMIESMSMDEIYNNIVGMNLGDNFIEILDEVFDLSDKSDNIILTVGTKNYVFYSKSNIDLDIYKYIESDDKYMTWVEYYDQIDPSGVMKKAYEDIILNRTDYVIIRTDNYYPDGTYYTIEDIVQEYHNNGMKNMDKYMIVTSAVITDNGDIFGERDNDFLSKNPDVNKIYIFKSVSIGTFLSNYEDLLTQCDQSVTTKIIQYRNSTEFGNGLINIFLITVTIIIIMIVIKCLDDDIIQIEQNKHNKPN
jgi:hypothetical protein